MFIVQRLPCAAAPGAIDDLEEDKGAESDVVVEDRGFSTTRVPPLFLDTDNLFSLWCCVCCVFLR